MSERHIVPAAVEAAAAADVDLQTLPEPFVTTTPRPGGIVNAAQATKRPLIVVLGGTGFIGLSVCERLVRRAGGGGQRVRVPTRRLIRGQTLQALPTVEIVVADVVHDDAMLRRTLAGADAVVNLVGTLHASQAQFDDLHHKLPARLAQACRDTGVRRIVHLSSIGAADDAPSRYLRSKAAGEKALQAAGDLEITILRPSVVFGARDRLTVLLGRMHRLLPFVAAVGGESKLQPVWVEDVAEAVVRCLGARSTIGQTIECVGPTAMTMAELVRACGRHTGQGKPVFGLPDPIARLGAMINALVPGQPLLSLDALDTLRIDNVASGQNADLSSLGIAPSALEAVAMQWLSDRTGPARMDRWRAMR